MHNKRTREQFKYPPGEGSISITTDDLQRLESGRWLNDSIIGVALSWIWNHLDDTQRRNTYIANTYLFTRMLAALNAEEKVKQLRLRLIHKEMKKTNWFTKRDLIFPINENQHWYLIVVCFPGPLLTGQSISGPMRPQMLIFNSLEDTTSKSAAEVIRKLITLARHGQDERMTTTIDSKDLPVYTVIVPQQTNQYDCGIHLIRNLEWFFTHPILHKEDPSQIWFEPAIGVNPRRDLQRMMKMIKKKALALTDNQETAKMRRTHEALEQTESNTTDNDIHGKDILEITTSDIEEEPIEVIVQEPIDAPQTSKVAVQKAEEEVDWPAEIKDAVKSAAEKTTLDKKNRNFTRMVHGQAYRIRVSKGGVIRIRCISLPAGTGGM